MCRRQNVKNHIKDLKDLRMLLIPLSIDIKVLQTLGTARETRALKCLKQDSQDLQDYLPRDEPSFCNGCLFRSFKTCMSIATPVCQTFQGPLGP